jgi:hypothetical protein
MNPQTIELQMARIEVKRGKGYKDAFRAYKIELNDETIGTIKAGEFLCFDIPPGKHHLRIKIDWCSSRYLNFEITEQQALYFECGNNVPTFAELIYIAFFRNKYLWLKQISK